MLVENLEPGVQYLVSVIWLWHVANMTIRLRFVKSNGDFFCGGVLGEILN